MSTTRMRGLVLGVLLASCATLPAAASAQATAPTLSTTTRCVDPQVEQSVDFTVTGLSRSFQPLIEMTAADDYAIVSYSGADVTPDGSGNASGAVILDPVTYGTLAGDYGDGAAVYLTARDPLTFELFAELRVPLCGAAQPDTTPPVLAPVADITADATSASGAPVSFTASATDDVDGSVPVTCDPASGSTFPVGTTTVTCSAKDAAGNATQGTFTVTVKAQAQPAPQPSLDDLLAQLRAAVLRGGSPQKACNALNVIENQIRARTGKTITQRQADQYLAAARFAAALLRCR